MSGEVREGGTCQVDKHDMFTPPNGSTLSSSTNDSKNELFLIFLSQSFAVSPYPITSLTRDRHRCRTRQVTSTRDVT